MRLLRAAIFVKYKKHFIMRKILLCIFAYLGIMQTVNSQAVNDGWTEIGYSAYSSELHSVGFRSSATGFAIGMGGSCLKTTDGGLNWSVINISPDYNLMKIIFTDPLTGYVGGNDIYGQGKVFKTTDGGQNWNEVLSFNNKFNCINFSDSLSGVIGSYEKYYLTTDGGVNWTTINTPGFNDILDLVFYSSDTIFAAPNNGSMGIQRTYNGGISWDTVTTFMNSIKRTTGGVLYASRYSPVYILRSDDMGNTWVNAYTGISGNPRGICFSTDSIGWAWVTSGTTSRIFHTSNAGNNWNNVFEDFVTINEIHYGPGGKVYAAGNNGLILESADGIIWDTLHVGQRKNMRRIDFADDNILFAVGDNGFVLKTNDAGINWNTVNIGCDRALSGVDFVNDSVAFIAGDDMNIYKTSNGGQSWVLGNNGFTSSQTTNIFAYDEQNIYVSGNGGLFKTTNGGANWNNTGFGNITYTVQALSPDTLITTLNGGVIKISTDGGSSWADKSSSSITAFTLLFKTGSTGYTLNAWGRVHYTANAGDNWAQKHNCGFAIYDAKFINDSVGYFVADNGYIGKTTDGGNTWFQVESGTIRHLRGICFTPDGTGYIVGKDGIMLRKSMQQVYKIKFDIRDESGVAINDAVLNLNSVIYPPGTDSVTGLIQGSYQYVISKAGLAPDTGIITLSSDTLIHIVLLQYRTVDIHLSNVFAEAVSGATVTLNSTFTETSDPTGKASFTQVLPGVNSYNISASGYNTLSGNFSISQDSSLYFVLTANLPPPLALAATAVGDDHFTANWDGVAAADSFLVYVSADNFATHIAGYDGIAVSSLNLAVTGLNQGVSYKYRLQSKNQYGFSVFSNEIQVTTTSGMSEAENDQLRFYPNPAADYIMVEMHEQGGCNIRITDVTGRIISEQTADMCVGTFRMDISMLPPGMYFLSVFAGDKTHTAKVVVK
jgi:photosystem II stability/assembly factor-like uncharacterized protein